MEYEGSLKIEVRYKDMDVRRNFLFKIDDLDYSFEELVEKVNQFIKEEIAVI